METCHNSLFCLGVMEVAQTMITYGKRARID